MIRDSNSEIDAMRKGILSQKAKNRIRASSISALEGKGDPGIDQNISSTD